MPQKFLEQLLIAHSANTTIRFFTDEQIMLCASSLFQEGTLPKDNLWITGDCGKVGTLTTSFGNP